jgi:hypothetical protein
MNNSTSESSEIQSAHGLVVCPLSADREGGNVENYKLHFCHLGELAEHGGICAKCHAKAAKRHGHFKSRDEQPVDISDRHELPNLEHDHVGFNANREVEQTTDFPIEEIYSRVDKETQEHFAGLNQHIRHEAGTALSMILQWIWCRDFYTAQRRWCVVTAGLRPDLLDDKSFAQIGKELGTTKQTLSKAMINFQESFGFKFSRGRSTEDRRNMSAAMMGHPGWNTRKKSKRSNQKRES